MTDFSDIYIYIWHNTYYTMIRIFNAVSCIWHKTIQWWGSSLGAWENESTLLLAMLPGHFWLVNVAPDRFLFMGQIEQLLFKHWATKWVMQNEIKLFTYWTVCKQMTESIRIILKDCFLEITLDRIMIFSILGEYLYL